MATSPSAMEIRRIKCLFCDSTFRDNFNVRRHINSKHPEMAKEILKINCSLCGLIYIRKKDEKPSVELCDECKKRTDIPPPETHNFPDEEEFRKWKHKLELDTSTRYMKSRRMTNLANGTVKTEFPCYRSTFLTPKSKRLRTKTSGSPQKTTTCPAKMICEFAPDGGAVSVSFFSQHKGHSLDANKVFEKVKKKEKIKKEKPPTPVFPSPVPLNHSFEVHPDFSMNTSDSLSNDYSRGYNHEEHLSNHYNSDLDLVLSQIENEGQMTSSSKMWLTSFCNAVENLASNKNNFAMRSSKSSSKKVLRDNNITQIVYEPQISYEAQTSNRMTEEERQSIIQMVLDDL